MKILVRQFKDVPVGSRFMFLSECEKYWLDGEPRTWVKIHDRIYKPPDVDIHYYIGSEKLGVGIQIEDPA